ncbi:hypothetical protein K492DRAFT_177209 [Lichtheimia hyalospora FSU 10163]|nr:hypothetical protein K492DRAFT_177209 [Lichtheimia hyalospora FSU 10163]
MKGLARKNVGHKVDMLFKCFMQEYGYVERGVTSDGTNIKAIKEGNIKLAKLLKDMLCLLVESSLAQRHQRHHVCTVGFVMSGLTIIL